MVNFESETHSLSEGVHSVATKQSHIVEINCAPALQRGISIVTLRSYDDIDIEISEKVLAHELRYL